jgi:hypothetical protein
LLFRDGFEVSATVSADSKAGMACWRWGELMPFYSFSLWKHSPGTLAAFYAVPCVKHVIHPPGTMTVRGDPLLSAELVAARLDASGHLVKFLGLPGRAGERLARSVGVEVVLVTTGATGRQTAKRRPARVRLKGRALQVGSHNPMAPRPRF